MTNVNTKVEGAFSTVLYKIMDTHGYLRMIVRYCLARYIEFCGVRRVVCFLPSDSQSPADTNTLSSLSAFIRKVRM
jgi:hypothetical protein